MTSPPVTVSPSTTVEDASRTMRRHRIGQLPVIDALTGRLVGILGRADVLSVYRRPDADIRQDVRDQVIKQDFAMALARFEVTVQNGRVTVTGTAKRRSQIPTLMHAIRRVEGVVSAQERLAFEEDDTYLAYPQL